MYNYDFGAVTLTHTPASGTGTSISYVDATRTYYPDGRLQQLAVTPGGAYKKWVSDKSNPYDGSHDLTEQSVPLNPTDQCQEAR